MVGVVDTNEFFVDFKLPQNLVIYSKAFVRGLSIRRDMLANETSYCLPAQKTGQNY